MSMILIHNPDNGCRIAYKIARVVYAETRGASLPVVEALSSMIYNLHKKSGREFEDIISDASIFGVLDNNNPDHVLLGVSGDTRAFQMCVRVATRMLRGGLNDTTNGAIIFHHDDVLPDWAVARGYIADIGGLLFYR